LQVPSWDREVEMEAGVHAASTVDRALARVLARLAEAAELLGVAEVADLAAGTAGRLQALREVAVVGEFKRGKFSLTPIKAVPAALETKPMAPTTPPLIPTATARVSCPACQITGTRAASVERRAAAALPMLRCPPPGKRTSSILPAVSVTVPRRRLATLTGDQRR
jgi:hypothetical protein